MAVNIVTFQALSHLSESGDVPKNALHLEGWCAMLEGDLDTAKNRYRQTCNTSSNTVCIVDIISDRSARRGGEMHECEWIRMRFI